MGPDTTPFANLTPVNSGTTLKGSKATNSDLNNLLLDSSEAMTANVWNIFYIFNSLKNQKNLQFKIVNNAGGNADIEFAFMRVV